MWDDFVSGIFTTFCEVGFSSVSPTALPDMRLYSGGAGWGGWLFEEAANRTPSTTANPRDKIPRFSVGGLSIGSLLRIVLTGPGPRGDGTITAARRKLIQLSPSPSQLRREQVGIRQRTDDLLLAYINADVLGDPFSLSRAVQFVEAVHAPALKEFLKLFAWATIEEARLDSQLRIEQALQTLTIDDCCDDMFRVKCFQEILRNPLASANTRPANRPEPAALPTALGRRLVYLFDTLPARVNSPVGTGPDPYGRLILYLSYFGQLNVVLIAQLLSSLGSVVPVPRVTMILRDLWREILNNL